MAGRVLEPGKGTPGGPGRRPTLASQAGMILRTPPHPLQVPPSGHAYLQVPGNLSWTAVLLPAIRTRPGHVTLLLAGEREVWPRQACCPVSLGH